VLAGDGDSSVATVKAATTGKKGRPAKRKLPLDGTVDILNSDNSFVVVDMK